MIKLKLRRLALLNYITFLIIMMVVWYYSVKRRTMAEYENYSQTIQELEDSIKLDVHFKIDSHLD